MKRCRMPNCTRPAEVSWPVRNSPHCLKCVAEARAFLKESEGRHPKFGVEPTVTDMQRMAVRV